jgi:MFS family permease
VLVVGVSRLVEGAGSAIAAPVTLGLLADSTEGDRVRRGRQMSFYELASSGGIAVGAAAGPLLWAAAGLWSFPTIAATYLAAAAMVALALRTRRDRSPRGGQQAGAIDVSSAHVMSPSVLMEPSLPVLSSWM